MVVIAAVVLAVEVLRPRKGCGYPARDAVLRTNLRTFRKVLEQYHRDNGEYPASLEALVTAGYLRSIPVDPITRTSETWLLTLSGSEGGIVNVHSGATKSGLDGRSYSEW
jgi:general secretion pathway protein G